MRSFRLLILVLPALLGLVSCSRDPAVVKKRYFESGNKYFERGRYREASIQYRNALKQDPKYGAGALQDGSDCLEDPGHRAAR